MSIARVQERPKTREHRNHIQKARRPVSGNQKNATTDLLTKKLEAKLANPSSSPEFDFHSGVKEVLSDVGLTAADCGGKLSFYGQDPIIPSPLRFGTMAALGLAARSVAVAALWRNRTGQGQDITVDVRKALKRFAG